MPLLDRVSSALFKRVGRSPAGRRPAYVMTWEWSSVLKRDDFSGVSGDVSGATTRMYAGGAIKEEGVGGRCPLITG